MCASFLTDPGCQAKEHSGKHGEHSWTGVEEAGGHSECNHLRVPDCEAGNALNCPRQDTWEPWTNRQAAVHVAPDLAFIWWTITVQTFAGLWLRFQSGLCHRLRIRLQAEHALLCTRGMRPNWYGRIATARLEQCDGVCFWSEQMVVGHDSSCHQLC